jgi:GH25 family lysozyme M1 (1,4-beta-N-acetylmuramidase)
MDRAHGIDISKYQTSLTLPEQTPFPVDFVIQRSSYALRKDERFDELSKDVQQVAIRGVYHYYSSGVSWQSQADLVLRLVDDNPEKTRYHMVWLDYEGHGTYNNLSARTAAEARQWLEYVQARFEGKVGLYTNPNHYIGFLDPYGDWMLSWPLWIAQYWFSPSPEKNPGFKLGQSRMNRNPDDWKFYQYSADGNGKGPEYGVKSPSVDLDVFNGTVEELRDWLGVPITPVESPVPGTFTDQMKREWYWKGYLAAMHDMESFIQTKKQE